MFYVLLKESHESTGEMSCRLTVFMRLIDLRQQHVLFLLIFHLLVEKEVSVPFTARLTIMSLVHQWVLILLSITFTFCDVNIIIVLCFLRPSTKPKTISFVTLRLIKQINLWTDFVTNELYPALFGKWYLKIKYNYTLGFWEKPSLTDMVFIQT